eukprot:3002473-Pyramimonas_sp.AAC.1
MVLFAAAAFAPALHKWTNKVRMGSRAARTRTATNCPLTSDTSITRADGSVCARFVNGAVAWRWATLATMYNWRTAADYSVSNGEDAAEPSTLQQEEQI